MSFAVFFRSVWALPVLAVLVGACPCISKGATFIVANANDSGSGSFRQAIMDANALGGADTIIFQISGSAPFTITPLSALPGITSPAVIDGTTQPGYAGTPLIELNGTSAGGNAGLRLLAGNSTVRGLAINRFGADGIRIDGPGTNVIKGNFIGTDTSGALARGNALNGILINESSGNIIGGTNAADRNVISANGDAGVYVLSAAGNVIQGNYIGTTVLGSGDLGNLNNGVAVYTAAGNLIGGAVAGARNVVSGNDGSGIYFFGDTSSSNLVQGNYIGTDVTGTLAISNVADGITLSGATNNTIGGTAVLAGNLISGNGKAGIFLNSIGAGNNVVAGNRIGTDASGMVALGNAYAGITLTSATNNLIGGLDAASRNLISGNKQDGIFITNSAGNIFEGNWIGLKASGSSALANLFNGISISAAGPNTIGGTAAGVANLISGNANYGIEIFSGSSGNLVAGNSIGVDSTGTSPIQNVLSGIRIESAGNTVGGSDAGARNLISGNGQDGVFLVGSNARSNVVQGNCIGTTATGSMALRNTRAGVGMSDAPGNAIGGAGSGQGNVISGNGDAGVYLIGSSATGNQIMGNKIGTDVAGTAGIGNVFEGIYLERAISNSIGGAMTGAGNIISANHTRGIWLTNASWNLLQGNLIGTKADGLSGLGNTFHSVECEVNACNNTIGGTGTAGNSIAFTQTIYAGVRIRDGATNNLIQGNSIFSNGGLGIDLSTYQVSPNDHCDADGGANQQQNFPVITQAFGGTEALIRGMLDSKASSSFVLEFFGNPSCSAQGNGEGRYYLGRKTVTTSAACSASFVVTLPAAIPPGYVVTATATDLSNNTSEFSACLAANPIPPLAIAAQGANQIALSWTNTATGFVLKETISLSPPILWTTVTNSAQSVNGNFVITVTRGAAAKFYELGFE